MGKIKWTDVPRPMIVVMVSEPTVDEAIKVIKRSEFDGAQAFIINLMGDGNLGLRKEFLNPKDLGKMFRSTDKPCMVCYYRWDYSGKVVEENDEERMGILKKTCGNLENVEIDSFSGLLMDYAKSKNANAIVKGLRAVSDFEYELQMAHMNNKLNPDIETMFIMTSCKYSYLSSSLVKEVAQFGGCIRGLVPEIIEEDIYRRFKK